MRKQMIYVLIAFCIGISMASMSASADPPDILGKWYGTWEVTEFLGWTSNFSMTFNETPYGLLAIMYVPEFGLFDQPLPVKIEDSPDGFIITIGVEGYSEIIGIIDGESMAGSFYAYFDADPPFVYNGIWQAKKYIDQVVFPGEAPGQTCDDLPPLYCMGDSEYCSELVLFEPSIGEGYIDSPQAPETEEDQCFSYIRQDLMMLIKYAAAKVVCKSADWDYGNFEPLGLLDMSEADGSTPGTSFGYLRHPPGTHDGGRDIDTAYYQLYAADNLGRPVGIHYDGYFEAYHLVEPPYALDIWRTALYIAYLAEHPRVRVIGVDGQIGLILEDAFDALVEWGWLDAGIRESIPLAYELEDIGWGWFYFHHHHMHISMNPVYEIVSSAEFNPHTLNRKSQGQTVTFYVEFNEDIDIGQLDMNSVALILNGHTMLYTQSKDVRISDYNHNGIADLTVKFDRQKVLESVGNGDVEISITGLIDGMFFQESDKIYVLGGPPSGLRQGDKQVGNSRIPFIRPGGRGIGK